MINITRPSQGNLTNTFFVTLLDNVTEIPSWYYFVFINRSTQDEVEYWSENISNFTGVQQFEIESNLFDGYDDGFWTYEAYGTDSDGGIVTTELLETGYMNLKTNTTFTPTSYTEQSNQFKTYNG